MVGIINCFVFHQVGPLTCVGCDGVYDNAQSHFSPHKMHEILHGKEKTQLAYSVNGGQWNLALDKSIAHVGRRRKYGLRP